MIRNKLEAFGSSNQQVRLMTSGELDKCLREALFSDSVGCSDSILYDISQATYHEVFFQKIMKSTWKCISSSPRRVKRIQKALNLLNYLIINGSDQCIYDVMNNLHILSSVGKLKFSPANRALGHLVSDKAAQIAALVLDNRTLQDKRRYSASIRDRFISLSSTNGIVETNVLHKPVFVLDKNHSIPPPLPSLPGVPGLPGVPNPHSVPSIGNVRTIGNTIGSGNIGISSAYTVGNTGGKGILSRLFSNKLKVTKPNIGLYGNSLHSQNQSFPSHHTYGGYGNSYGNSYGGYGGYGGMEGFNAFPEVSVGNDYYTHSFHNNRKTDENFNKLETKSDSTFKRYSTTESSYSDSDSSYSTSSSYSSKSSTSSSSDSSYSSSSSSSSSSKHYRTVDRGYDRGYRVDRGYRDYNRDYRDYNRDYRVDRGYRPVDRDYRVDRGYGGYGGYGGEGRRYGHNPFNH